MLRKFFSCGCLLLLLALGGLVWFATQTQEGQWLAAMVILYSAIIVGGAMAHDTIPGTVTALNRLEEPTSYSAGSLRFSYEGVDGSRQEKFRQVMYSTQKFRELAVGDAIDVWVCRNDRTKVKLVGYGTYEPEKCMDDEVPPAEERRVLPPLEPDGWNEPLSGDRGVD